MPSSQNLAKRPGSKFWELANNMKTKLSTFFRKDLSDSFSIFSNIEIDENQGFCPLRKTCLTDLNISSSSIQDYFFLLRNPEILRWGRMASF